MKWTTIGSFLAASLLAMTALVPVTAQAAPILDVTLVGSNVNGNLEWTVEITPDGALLPGSVAVELAFEVQDSTIVNVDVNEPEWFFDNPGNNPFTNTATTGLWTDGSQLFFTSYGSTNIFNDTTPVTLLTLETLGVAPTTVLYGDAATGGGDKGDLIGQGGLSFHDYNGSVVGIIPEPAACLLGMLALAGTVVAGRRS